MSRTKWFLLVRLFLAVVALAVGALAALEGCKSHSDQSQSVEKPISIATPQPSPGVPAAAAQKLPAPTETEVEAAFHRVFGDNFTLSTANRPYFIQGDFNGDGSEDLALIARPAPGKLHDINSELANWIIQDADKAFLASTKRVVVPPRAERPTIAAGEDVLAIIHGFGAMGWRNPDARQTYLVKHAAAPLLGTAPSFSQKAIRAMHLPYETEVIRQVRNKRKGFLFWTGGVYAWHPSEG